MTKRDGGAEAKRGGRRGHFKTAHAAAWDKWFHVIEGGAQSLNDRMVELAAIQPGHRVLDVATGLARRLDDIRSQGSETGAQGSSKPAASAP